MIQFHIRDWLDLHRSYAKIHGGIEFEFEDIDYAFGVVEGFSTLWGGRAQMAGHGDLELTKVDEYWLYDHNIGVKLPFTTKVFNDELYNKSLDIQKEYHRKGNAVITYHDELGRRIKEDFPD